MSLVTRILPLLLLSLAQAASASAGTPSEVLVTTLAGLKGTFGAQDGNGTFARFNYPFGIAVLPNGNVVVADTSNHAIRLITADGVVTTLAGLKGTFGTQDGSGTAARFYRPFSIAALPNGNMVVADQWNNVIRHVTADGVVTTLAGMKGISGTQDGTGAAARFNNPGGIAVLPNGNMVVAEYGNHAIRLITAGGVVSTLAGLKGTFGTQDGTGTAARFNYPSGIAVLPNGNMVVTDRDSHAIRLVTADGVVSTLAGLKGSVDVQDGNGTAARFNNPNGIAVLPNGNIVVADEWNHAIRLVTADGVVTTLAGLKGTFGTQDGTSTAARFNRPTGIAVLPNGNMVVVDTANHAIRFINTNASSSRSTSHSRSFSASFTDASSPTYSDSASSSLSDGSLTGSPSKTKSAASQSFSRSNSPSHSEMESPSLTYLPSTADPSPAPTLASGCFIGYSNVSTNSLLDPTYELLWKWANASTPLELSMKGEWTCASQMNDCVSAAAETSSCDAATQCTRQYIDCLFQAAVNTTGTDSPRLKALNVTLQQWKLRRQEADFQQEMLQSCAISACRVLKIIDQSCNLSISSASFCLLSSPLPHRPTESATTSLVSTIISRTAAMVVVSTSAGGTALSALISSPTTATKAPALASLSQVIQCAFTEDDTEPSPFDFPIPVSIGSSPFAKYVGSGLITTLCLVVFPLIVTVLIGRAGGRALGRPMLRFLQQKVIANGAMMALGYFGPLAFKLPFLIIWHSGKAADVAVAIISPVLVLGIIAYLLFIVLRRFDSAVIVATPCQGESSELEFANKDQDSLFVETFGPLFDACRSVRLRHRLFFFEDFLLAAVLQLLEGVRPEQENSCGTTAGLMGVLCWLHTLYLLVARPYGDRLELVLVIVGSLLMSVMATVGLVITLTIQADITQSSLYTVFAYLGLATTMFFFVQCCILGFVAIVASNKEAYDKLLGRKEASNDGDGMTPRRILDVEPVTEASNYAGPGSTLTLVSGDSSQPGNPLGLGSPLLESDAPPYRIRKVGPDSSLTNPLAF